MTYGSIWLRSPSAARTGRPAEWSREQVTAAAVAIADEEGLAAVTMRRVAARLGTGAASLYRYVDTRDDLVDLMVDHALSELATAPDTDNWRADVVAHHMAVLAALRRRPWLADAARTRPPSGPNALRLVEGTLARMAGHPGPGSRKMETVGVLFGLVQTYALAERPGGGVLDEEFVAVQAQLLQRAVADGAHPHLAAALAESPPHPGESPDDQLARVFGMILDGMLPGST